MQPTSRRAVQLLSGHVARGRFPFFSLNNNLQLRSLDNQFITVINDGISVTLQAQFFGTTAQFVGLDVESCNSTIHIIDTVLIPGEAPAPAPMVPAPAPAPAPFLPIAPAPAPMVAPAPAPAAMGPTGVTTVPQPRLPDDSNSTATAAPVAMPSGAAGVWHGAVAAVGAAALAAALL